MESSRFPLYSGEREVYQATDQSVVSPPDCQYIIQHTVQENLKNHELELQVCIWQFLRICWDVDNLLRQSEDKRAC